MTAPISTTIKPCRWCQTIDAPYKGGLCTACEDEKARINAALTHHERNAEARRKATWGTTR